MKDEDISRAIDDLFDDGELNNSVVYEENVENLTINDNIKEISDENINTNAIIEPVITEEVKDEKENIPNDVIAKSDDAINTGNAISIEETKKEELPTFSASINNDNNNLNTNIKKENSNNKIKIILYFLIGFVIGTIILILVNMQSSDQTKKTVCTYQDMKEEYNLVDEYVIEYKKNNITYITGKYSYKAKIESFNAEVERLRNEKLDVIINGNGIDGIVHGFEVSEDTLSIESYYDFEKIDFKAIDKIDYNVNPISYIELNSNLKYDKLIKDLEKKEYKCINSK